MPIINLSPFHSISNVVNLNKTRLQLLIDLGEEQEKPLLQKVGTFIFTFSGLIVSSFAAYTTLFWDNFNEFVELNTQSAVSFQQEVLEFEKEERKKKAKEHLLRILGRRSSQPFISLSDSLNSGSSKNSLSDTQSLSSLSSSSDFDLNRDIGKIHENSSNNILKNNNNHNHNHNNHNHNTDDDSNQKSKKSILVSKSAMPKSTRADLLPSPQTSPLITRKKEDDHKNEKQDEKTALARPVLSTQSSVDSTPSPALQRWRKAVSLIRKERVTKNLAQKREFTTMIEKLKALGYQDGAMCVIRGEQINSREDPPKIIFMGGGIGSGKSTAVNILTRTEWWKKHGQCVVLIEADAMKMTDPVFQTLNAYDDKASELVHQYSVKAAEELFLAAVKARRDILFDGTLMWAPFVEQTVAMIRDNNHIYKRGPGYRGPGDEVYWEIEKEANAPMRDYVIELVGVTAEASTAVNRGIVRRFVTGRGVPRQRQLASHQMFSEAFPKYLNLFDCVSLYDNNAQDTLLTSKTPEPDLILHQRRCGLVYKNDEKYKTFIRKENINPHAKTLDDLYTNIDHCNCLQRAYNELDCLTGLCKKLMYGATYSKRKDIINCT